MSNPYEKTEEELRTFVEVTDPGARLPQQYQCESCGDIGCWSSKVCGLCMLKCIFWLTLWLQQTGWCEWWGTSRKKPQTGPRMFDWGEFNPFAWSSDPDMAEFQQKILSGLCVPAELLRYNR